MLCVTGHMLRAFLPTKNELDCSGNPQLKLCQCAEGMHQPRLLIIPRLAGTATLYLKKKNKKKIIKKKSPSLKYQYKEKIIKM